MTSTNYFIHYPTFSHYPCLYQCRAIQYPDILKSSYLVKSCISMLSWSLWSSHDFLCLSFAARFLEYVPAFPSKFRSSLLDLLTVHCSLLEEVFSTLESDTAKLCSSAYDNFDSSIPSVNSLRFSSVRSSVDRISLAPAFSLSANLSLSASSALAVGGDFANTVSSESPL